MMIKLKKAIFILLGITSSLSIIIVSIILNFFFDKFFREYFTRKLEERNFELVNNIKLQYVNERWNLDAIQNIGVNALEEGLILKLVDIKNNIIWDATHYNSGICEKMISTITFRMNSKYPSLKGGYTTKNYDLKVENQNIGYLTIGYYGPFYYTEQEFYFIGALNNLLIITTLLTLSFSFLLSYFVSKKISKPLSNITNITKVVSEGKYNSKIREKSFILEINTLINSVNNLAQSLLNQHNLRKKLTQNIAHELRTPMTTIQTHIEALIDGIWPITKERLECILEETIRINKLMIDLNELSKFDNKSIELRKKKIHLDSLLKKVILLNEHNFISKNIKIEYKLQKISIFVDEDKIKQAFINLVTNAYKFTNKNGYFRIILENRTNIAHIEFINSGAGIPAKDIDNIFERFYRADESRNRKTGGSGIGLSIVKEIIEAHDGTIKVESEKNKETKFIITLPLKVGEK